MADLPDGLVAQIAANVAESYPDSNVTPDVVTAVLDQVSAAQELAAGAPVDTRMINPTTGDTAKRVLRNGIPQWRITRDATGATDFDWSPELGDGWILMPGM